MPIKNNLPDSDIIARISGKSWLVIAPDEWSCLQGMAGSILDVKATPDLKINQVLFANKPAKLSEQGSNLTESGQALGLSHCYWLGRENLSFCPKLQNELQRIVSYTAADTLFIPFLSRDSRHLSRIISLIWQLAEGLDFKGLIYVYETGLDSCFNTLINITDSISQKQYLLEQYTEKNQLQNIAKGVIARNKARTLELAEQAVAESESTPVEYLEALFRFDLSSNQQLFQTINRYLPIYDLAKLTPKQPLISVIIRTMDRPELLAQAISSLIAQIYPNLELIVVNDGGVDVLEQLQPARHQLSHVNYQNLEKNVGRAAAANIGLQQVTGDYVMFLDDDDLIDIDHIMTLNQAIQEHPGTEVAYCGIQVTENKVYNRPFNKDLLRVFNYIPIHAVLFSRHFIDRGCHFDESLHAFEDWDFWIQLSQFSNFLHLNRVSAVYRNLGNSDGGVFKQTHNVDSNRHKVLEKWLPRWSINEIDSILKTLRYLPTDAEHELRKQCQSLQAQITLSQKKFTDINQQLTTQEKQHKIQIENFKQQQKADKEHILQLQKALDELRQQLHQIESQLNQTESQLYQVFNSTSWRLTGPLRKGLSKIYQLMSR